MVALLALWGAAPHSGTGLVTVVASLGREGRREGEEGRGRGEGRDGRRGGREGKVGEDGRREGRK